MIAPITTHLTATETTSQALFLPNQRSCFTTEKQHELARTAATSCKKEQARRKMEERLRSKISKRILISEAQGAHFGLRKPKHEARSSWRFCWLFDWLTLGGRSKKQNSVVIANIKLYSSMRWGASHKKKERQMRKTKNLLVPTDQMLDREHSNIDLRSYMEHNGLSSDDVAAICDVPRRRVYAWSHGKRLKIPAQKMASLNFFVLALRRVLRARNDKLFFLLPDDNANDN